ncbi:surface lipoprotein assembly modifier [uncultured Nevskia sp.]|uniref:surface lipoprotein assembly modifier n=1 Tax=uncultured Nevskia sp. TaxID=228950 RepID=UPI0025F9A2F6|nr:surface lipoprotein assembly modifier [uncultured Nevskia sp.]
MTPYGSAQAEYNSNVFSLPNSDQAFLETGDRRLADETLRLIIGLQARLPVSQQTFRAKLEGRRFDYLHLDRLDHNEYRLSTGLDWRLATFLTGTLDLSQERRLAPFTDRISTNLTLESERVLSASSDLEIGNEWRLETALRSRALDSPLPNFPGFKLEENTADVAIKYLIGEGLDAGIYGKYQFGTFKGVPEAGDFDEQSLGLVVDYSIDELSRVAAQAGYTRRQDERQADANGRSSAITGKLSYFRQLTGKTSVGIDAFRRVNSYVGDASTVQETGAGLALNWAPTVKIGVFANYQYGISRFQQSGTSASNDSRHDDSHVASLKLAWQALSWLVVNPYTAYQVRSSTIERNSFKAIMVGLELGARL